jgi:glycopeptide antibiotics resistance protein
LPLGRTSNVDDIILNTLGGMLGAAGADLVVRMQRRQRQPGSAHGEDIAG